MKKTKLFTSIAALALVLGLGACEVTDDGFTPDESEGTTQSSETTGDTTPSESTPEGGNEGGDGETYTHTGPEEGNYFLGFDVDETIYYINGGTVSETYSYEGTLTTNIGLAVPVTLAAADGDNAYYLTFELDETTYYICIVNTGEHINLQYLEEKTPIYWDEANKVWVDEEDTYFLCYNATYECAYASEIASWLESSPIGTLYEVPVDWAPYVPTLPEGDVYKLGALDSANYCYKYFDGTAYKSSGNSYLNVTDDWDKAADVVVDSTEDGTSFCFIDADGEVKYISYTTSNSNSLPFTDEPFYWYWNETNEAYEVSQGGRFLGLQDTGASIRTYANTNLSGYSHATIFATKPTDPKKPEVTTTYEQVSGLGDGGEFYAGGYSSNTLYLTDGGFNSNYYELTCTSDLDIAVPFTVTGDATSGYKLTNADGQYVYVYYSYRNSKYNHDFGFSDAATVPNSGTNIFYWNDAASTLYCNGSTIGSTYTYVYFEFYSNNVCGYGTNTLSASTNNLAHFYQQVTD